MNYLNILFLISFAFAESLTFNKDTGQAIPNYLGEIKVLKGKVFKKNADGNISNVNLGTKIYKNETLTTEEKSFARVLMIDDTEISLAGNSELNFETFNYQTKTDRNSIYNFIRGQLSASIKNRAKSPKDIVFKTKNAVLGIRGTKLFINNKEYEELEVTELGLTVGLAELTNNLNQIQKELPPGVRVIIAKNKKNDENFETEKKFNPKDLEAFKDPEPFLPFDELEEVKEKFKISNVRPMELTSKPNDKTKDKESGSFENLKRLNEKLKEQ